MRAERSARSASVARTAARRAASGSSTARTSDRRASSRTSTPVTNIPRRGYTSTSRSCASRMSASRTGVRLMPRSSTSARSPINAPGASSSETIRSRIARYALSARDCTEIYYQYSSRLPGALTVATHMPSSLEIAQDARLRPIADLAADIGLLPDEVELYGRYKAKINLSVLDRLADKTDAKLVNVTAITPTKAGEGKTTTSVSLTQGLGFIGHTPVLCLREASLGPVFGIKGGAAGAGYAQVVPMEDMNLHFTGDIHAIGAANNLLAAMLEAHLLHGNELNIDPLSISWRRCVDINDRALRDIAVGLGGRANGYVRQTGFDITAASEVMAIVAVSRDLQDLRKRLGAITVGSTFEGEPVTAEQLRAAGAMTVLLKETIKPNLVQTLEGQPALVHCDPFANIAHGNNSLVADRVALKLGDVVVTESGFGADMGMEKFFDIVCRVGGLTPSAVVLVATVKALKHHGGDPEGGAEAIEAGAANLVRHLGIVREFGLNAVVAVNRFPADSDEEIEQVRSIALANGAFAAEANDGVARGGEGATALAEAVVAGTEEPSSFAPIYPLDATI